MGTVNYKPKQKKIEKLKAYIEKYKDDPKRTKDIQLAEDALQKLY